MKHGLRIFWIFSIILFLLPAAQASELPHLKKDGQIRFYMYHLSEGIEITYLDAKGEWIPEAEARLQKLFRSRDDNATLHLDRRLVELADHLQDHFQVDTIEVISAYRSPEFNHKLKTNGHHVAGESLHTKGLAMDVHLDEIKESMVRDYLLSLKLGGVGYYGKNLMVHMDFGPVRTWQDSAFVENTEVGIFNQNNRAKIRTNRFFYKGNEVLNLSFFDLAETARLHIQLQKFYRGHWVTLKELPHLLLQEKKLRLTEMGFGKYRVRFENGPDWQNSNEFYLKRI